MEHTSLTIDYPSPRKRVKGVLAPREDTLRVVVYSANRRCDLGAVSDGQDWMTGLSEVGTNGRGRVAMISPGETEAGPAGTQLC